MAITLLRSVMIIIKPSNTVRLQAIHTTPSLSKVVAGKFKRTKDQSRPLTYEEAHQPNTIAHKKSWNSWNTSTLQGGMLKNQILNDDILIRKFLVGTFHDLIYSEIIIKRQHNIVRLAFICGTMKRKVNMSFLIGYSEELLGHILQCPVKIEPQFVTDRKSVIFTYV